MMRTYETLTSAIVGCDIYIETLLARPRLRGAFDAISAAVVGVILNLSVWFALHVLFADVALGRFGPRVALSGLQPLMAGYVVLAALLLLGLRLPLLAVLAAMAAIAGGTTFLI